MEAMANGDESAAQTLAEVKLTSVSDIGKLEEIPKNEAQQVEQEEPPPRVRERESWGAVGCAGGRSLFSRRHCTDTETNSSSRDARGC